MSLRRYDIDWLRVITIGLLLLYHIAIVFQPWGVLIGFIQSDESIEMLWIPMSMINIWRIPLLFFVSGMGVCFAIKKRNWKQLLLERTRRILIPFLFGIICVVPIHFLLWQYYYKQDFNYLPQQSHLWFLKNIFIYVVLLSPFFFYLKKHENGTFNKWLKKVFNNPFGLLLIIIPFVLEAITVNPDIYEMYALTLHGFLLGLLAFLFGFLCIYSGKEFWSTLLKWRWLILSLAITLFCVRFKVYDLKAPNYYLAVESIMWIFSMFGFSFKHLNHHSKVLTYLSQGAYPIYIIHMLFIYLGALWILPLDLPVLLKFIALVAFTFIGCFILYDLIIKRVPFLRPLFGLKKME